MTPLEVIEGGKGKQGNFPCPWCGKTFDRRFINSDGLMSLQEHWMTDPRCKSHANVNNPTQTKYGAADAVFDVPGDYNLHKVRVADCVHQADMRQLLYASDGHGGWTDEVVGWRCGWCYIEMPIEESGDTER